MFQETSPEVFQSLKVKRFKRKKKGRENKNWKGTANGIDEEPSEMDVRWQMN